MNYSKQKNGKYYCMLPGNIWKEIPYVNWYEDIEWATVYYAAYPLMIAGTMSWEWTRTAALEDILEILDIRVK